MLLRRVIEHVRDQNWTAVLIDFAIVVIGVFIGIQVANWNDVRRERQMEREVLIRLYEDFQLSVEGLDRDIRFLEQQLADQSLMISALSECSLAPADDLSFQRGVATLGYINPPRLFRRTIDEVAASGRTEIIRNEAVAAELSRIVALVEWRGAGHSQIALGMQPHRKYLQSLVRHNLKNIDNPFIANHYGGVSYEFASLCGDEKLINGIAAVSYETLERAEAYRPILRSYEAFLPMIAAELRSRWGVQMQ